tara:strand:- start:186 stop:1613 length:1428 start_codon:yes stop_codon:yes gene_type:complete
MSFNSSRRATKTKKESIVREIGSGMFISIRTIDEIEDIISTSEAYMTDPTAIFNSDNTKVLFYYNTKNKNEIEEMETLFKRTVKKGSTINLSDAFYLDESSGDDTTYDLSGTYKFEKYDATTKTIIASPININKQSDTNLTYNSKYWIGSLLWTTSDPIHTRTSSYEIVNFLGKNTEHSFSSMFGNIQENDKIEVEGVGSFTIKEYKVDEDEEWERIVVKEPIPEKDLLGEKTFIRILRSDRNQPKEQTQGTIPTQRTINVQTSSERTINEVGACCLSNGSCIQATQYNCEAFGATFINGPCIDDKGNERCTSYKVGACCNGCSCRNTIESECPTFDIDAGPNWFSGMMCSDCPSGGLNPCCPPPEPDKVGKCCFSNTCGIGDKPHCKNWKKFNCLARCGTWSEGSCGNNKCCDTLPSPSSPASHRNISEFSKAECDANPNTHWMGSSITGYCIEGAVHQPPRVSRRTLPSNFRY